MIEEINPKKNILKSLVAGIITIIVTVGMYGIIVPLLIVNFLIVFSIVIGSTHLIDIFYYYLKKPKK